MNEILLEYYAGKNKDLLACESILRDIIKEVKTGQYDFTSSGVTRTNKLNTELEQRLQNVFKVKQLHIYWKQGMVNAFTITPIIFTTMDANKKLKAGLENNLKVHIAVYEDLITQANLNERELLAFILHEIGHNFYCCPIMIVSNILFAILCLPAALLLMILKGLMKFGDAVGDFLKENIPFLYKLEGMYLSLLGDFNRFLSGYNNIMSIPTHLAMLIANIVSFNTWTSYGGEKGADSMAARYGYGPDLMSGLMKLKELPGSIYSQVMSSTGEVGKLWSNFNLITMDLIQLIMFDPHPSTRNRCRDTLAKLKRDLATNDYPAPMKKDIEVDIKKVEQMLEVVDKNPLFKESTARQNVFKVVDFLTGGNRDLREFFNAYYSKQQF